MPDAPLENDRNALIERITDSYARGSIEMPAFESAVARISACGDRAALVAEASSLGLALPAPVREALPSVIGMDCVSGSIRKSGDWVRAGRYRIGLQSSSARLDLREYEGARGFRLEIELAARSSTLRLIVPRGFEVEDGFAERISSVVRNRPKGESRDGNLITLGGTLNSSVVKVSYR